MNHDSPVAPPPDPFANLRARPLVTVCVALLLLLGTALFATGAIAKVRHHDPQPPPAVLGVAAWQIATAGFACTLSGALWLRRLIA